MTELTAITAFACSERILLPPHVRAAGTLRTSDGREADHADARTAVLHARDARAAGAQRERRVACGCRSDR